jgi:hypothetical protein
MEAVLVGRWSVDFAQPNYTVLKLDFTDGPLLLAMQRDQTIAMARAILDQDKPPTERGVN